MPLLVSGVNIGNECQNSESVPPVVWSYRTAVPTFGDVPKLRDEDHQFAQRLGAVLRALRDRSGWTRPEAAEHMGLSDTTLGRWERGENSPKGYDLGRLFRGYQPYGAQSEWFFEPPEIVRIDPVQAKLDELERTGAIAGDLREARVAARRRQAAARRAASRGKQSRGTQPRSTRPRRDQ